MKNKDLIIFINHNILNYKISKIISDNSNIIN